MSDRRSSRKPSFRPFPTEFSGVPAYTPKTEKLRPRFVPGKVIKKAITQAAPTMKTAIENIRQDKGYSQLSPENQQKLEEILQQFRLAEEEEEKLNVNPSTEQQLDLKDTEE